MNVQELDKGLRECFSIFNRQARLLTPRALEKNMDATFQTGGVEWFLDAAEHFKVAEANYVRENLATVLSHLKTEKGGAELRRYVAENQDKLKQCRRKIVQLTRVSGLGEQGAEFKLDSLPDNGDIYRILMDTSGNQTKGGDNDAGHDEHPHG